MIKLPLKLIWTKMFLIFPSPTGLSERILLLIKQIYLFGKSQIFHSFKMSASVNSLRGKRERKLKDLENSSPVP